jgi:hypothetical protein
MCINKSLKIKRNGDHVGEKSRSGKSPPSFSQLVSYKYHFVVVFRITYNSMAGVDDKSFGAYFSQAQDALSDSITNMQNFKTQTDALIDKLKSQIVYFSVGGFFEDLFSVGT